MNSRSTQVGDHYQAAIDDRDALLIRLKAVVDAMPQPVSVRSLAALDQFHVGGLLATIAFADRLGVTRDLEVLDAGSGLGGPSRYLAETYGCYVEGVDLSPDYVTISQMLADRSGLADKVTYTVGDLSALVSEAERFDLVWTQHVVMNIADREQLYRELRRVLKRGGRLAFYDPIAADEHPDVIYPVPWAQTSETSTLLNKAETIAALRNAGLELTRWDDVSEQAMGWAAQQGPPGQPGVNAAMIVGARMAELAKNFGQNVRENRLRLVMGVCNAV